MYVKKINVYGKELSKIPGLQNESVVTYSLVKTVKSCETYYGIEISKIEEGKASSVLEESISKSKDEVLNLLTLLYENCHELSTCQDVICDFIDSNYEDQII